VRLHPRHMECCRKAQNAGGIRKAVSRSKCVPFSGSEKQELLVVHRSRARRWVVPHKDAIVGAWTVHARRGTDVTCPRFGGQRFAGEPEIAACCRAMHHRSARQRSHTEINETSQGGKYHQSRRLGEGSRGWGISLRFGAGSRCKFFATIHTTAWVYPFSTGKGGQLLQGVSSPDCADRGREDRRRWGGREPATSLL